MICERPFVRDGMAHPCGSCHPCRIRRRKVWTHRLILEARLHGDNSFLTLTYDDNNHPKDGCLSTRDFTLFLKKLRKKGYKFRYYGVGEYGSRTYRPHYHLACFGLPTCLRGQTDLRKEYCCAICDDVKKAWGKGAIQCARLEPASAAYVAGYVTEKLTKGPIPPHLTPEFQRMSLKPGLGHDVMHDVAHTLMATGWEEIMEDVPLALQHGPVKMALGRYLRKKLRLMVGRDEKAPQSVIEKAQTDLHDLRNYAFNNSLSLSNVITEANVQKRLNYTTRHKLRSGKRHL